MTIQDQPPPEPNSKPAIWPLVMREVEASTAGHASPSTAMLLADMAERHRVGVERYGTPLQPFNGRDALVDAYQEALDLVAYTRQAQAESFAETDRWRALGTLHTDALRMAMNLRRMIYARDGR